MIFLLVLFLFALLYYYSTKNYDYWEKRNVKHDPPVPLFGNHLPNQLGLKSIGQVGIDVYQRYQKERFVGYYRGATPMLIIRDLDLVKQIVLHDFLYFYKRDDDRDCDLEPLYQNLAHTSKKTWRVLRQFWSPVFTTAKLRAMYPVVMRCVEKLQNKVTQLSNSGAPYDALELLSRFNIEFTGASSFGIDMDTINRERSQFTELGKAIFRPNLRNRILSPIIEIFPLAKKFIRVDDHTVEQAVKKMVEQIREQRRGKPRRHDFIDLLLESEGKGKIVGDSIEKFNDDGTPARAELRIDLDFQASQVFMFFSAGHKTSSLSTSYALHNLACHPKIQKQVQAEIDKVLLKYDNNLCYEALAEMDLLQMVFKESLRLLPPTGVIKRVCTKRYKIPNTNITIDPGVIILIPVHAIHLDEKYYVDPKEFRPERFTPEALKARPKYSYLPFGEGPRNCVGKRLAEVQVLTGLAAILQKFSVEPAKSSTKDIKLIPTYNVVQNIEAGLPLIFKLRKNTKMYLD